MIVRVHILINNCTHSNNHCTTKKDNNATKRSHEGEQDNCPKRNDGQLQMGQTRDGDDARTRDGRRMASYGMNVYASFLMLFVGSGKV